MPALLSVLAAVMLAAALGVGAWRAGARHGHALARSGADCARSVRVERLSRLAQALSAVNRAIAHGQSLDEVFALTCRACVDSGSVESAWISLDAADSAASRQRSGEARLVSLPIMRDGRTLGHLHARGHSHQEFVPEAARLLEELADGLAFAIRHFDDLAARREAEAALRRREAQLLKAEEIARLGHWSTELASGTTHWSPQMYRLFGRAPAAGPADTAEVCDTYCTVESARLTRRCIAEAIATGQRVQFEQEMAFPDGRTAFHATVIVPVFDGGKVASIEGTVQDVTEHKQNEARLAKMASRLAQVAAEYEDLYQHAPCGYHSLDKDGVFQRINDTELAWLGYSRAEVIGRMRVSDLLPPERMAAFRENFVRLMADGEVHDIEQDLVCKDGSLLPVLINATVIRDESGRFLMSRTTTYNMSDRRRIEHERELYLRRLARLSRHLVHIQEEERRRLSASLHDRTSPNLAAINLNLATIAKSSIPPEIAESLADIRALIEDTNASIREISAELRPPLLDYAGLLPALEAYLYQFSRRTGIDAKMAAEQIGERPPAEIESLLFRVVQEALTNCAKHAHASHVMVRLERAEARLVLTIRDDGEGFDPETLGREGESVGLGMLNMREMTEFAGGHFRLETYPGAGTTIQVEI